MAEAPMLEVGDEILPPEMMMTAPELEPIQDMESAPPQKSGSGQALIRDRFLVDAGSPLPFLDTPSAKAYEVEDRRDLGSKLYGLVCTPGLPTRTKVMAALKDEEFDGIVPLVEWDVAYWPLLEQHTQFVIYERPKGGRIIDAMEAGNYKLNEYDFPRRIMAPLVEGIRAMDAIDHPHRAINPANVFFMDEARQIVALGDCATVPHGFDQPMLFESIDRAMAGRSGRGRGGLADDVYALGVTLVVLMLRYNPVANISDEEMLAMKMEHGSYAAICGNARLPIPLLEPLRAMLHDTVEERWGLDQLTGWLDGQKQPSLRQVPIVKSDFPYRYEGRDHFTPRTLSRAMARHRETAMKVIKDEALISWLRKGVKDATRADAIKATLEMAMLHKDHPEGTEDFIVSKACMVLDPKAPIQYKGFSFMPDGYGPALAVEVLRRGNAEIPIEVLRMGLPAVWYSLQQTVFAGASIQQADFAKLSGYLNNRDLGYGYERCLYEFNPSIPCLSEFIANDYVIEINTLLQTLDAAANSVDNKVRPIDRHITAFIAAHFREDIHPHLKALAAPSEEASTIGMLSLLAFLQWKLRIGPLLGLSSWVGGLLGPAINTYHSRTTRREIEKEIPRLVRKGSLPELFDLIDNAEKRRVDAGDFEAAIAEYAAAEFEVRDIEGAGTERQTKAERTGKQAAAVLSIVLSMIVVSVLFISEMF
ncbi:MAG: hypothetical protein O3A85_06195 [Proteobacteria bacterium]|nr:hypothetical protein [Pseudomonadota bacterium]